MPKRKSSSNEPASLPAPSLTSLDAALDLLACETFARLASLTSKFETAAGVKLNNGVIKRRWDEACMRYWLMKSMDGLSCSSSAISKPSGTDERNREIVMADEDHASGNLGRTVTRSSHPGAIIAFDLDVDDALVWRRWSPRPGDLVLVELPANAGRWPGKIIDKQVCFQGRSIPRGNHFYAVRVYDEDIEPTVTIKSRMLPLSLRPTPPLMASTSLLSAYNHASHPIAFDQAAAQRETAAAHGRTHPGAGDDEIIAKAKAEKERWQAFSSWLMDERRVEKLRALVEERNRRLKSVAQSSVTKFEGLGTLEAHEQFKPRKRRVAPSLSPLTFAPPKHNVQKVDGNPNSRGGIFKVSAVSTPPRRHQDVDATQPMSSYIRPALSAPFRSNSPRRTADRRRNGIFSGASEYSPRPRGGPYIPPRVLPNGIETAPFGSPSPSMSRQFDFVSPLGPVKFGTLATDDIDDDAPMLPKTSIGTSLEVVHEEGEEEGSWTVVSTHRRRAGSVPIERTGKSGAAKPTTVDDLVLAS